MFFVFQDMAVPHVLGSRDPIAGKQTGTGWCSAGHIEFHVHRDHLSRVHSHRLFPTALVRVGRTGSAWNCPWREDGLAVLIERPLLPFPDRDVHKVEVHGVRIGSEVKDLPPLELTLVGKIHRGG